MAAAPAPTRGHQRERLLFLAFVGPNLALFALFSYWPLAQSVWLSFTEWDMIAPEKAWVGLDNWILALTDRVFWQVLLNTFVFTVGGVGVMLALALAVAILLNWPLAGRNVARMVLFGPYVISGSAIAVVWVFLLDPNWVAPVPPRDRARPGADLILPRRDQLPKTRPQDAARVYIPNGDQIIGKGLERVLINKEETAGVFQEVAQTLQREAQPVLRSLKALA